MKINEVITESKKSTKLKENTEVTEIGRTMMDMAIKQKDDEVSNNMSTLGAALTRFGTRAGPQNIKDVVKQTGLDPNTIQKYMKAAVNNPDHGKAARQPDDGTEYNPDDEPDAEGYVREEDKKEVSPEQINAYKKWFKKWNQIDSVSGEQPYAEGIMRAFMDTGDVDGDGRSNRDPNQKAYDDLNRIFPEFDKDIEEMGYAIDQAGVTALDPLDTGPQTGPRR